ncbi:hypothetical protein G4V62_16720 [Bacillaceae bacterium SIJ1]|uniref:LuxR C-terminal-related transcriptional regulator n=1 Tax=Litoribacterium kuwaitense TaxID=1398745 RepID=UPI0013ED9051|nr:LuxR C-terminal-related transcriptional regulator [Litoribacterium kuwaitense]NGP46509.1 hypothetical protein [Litoribacterium kuwaitense]
MQRQCKGESYKEAAAISYIHISMLGRAKKLKKKQEIKLNKEKLLLNEQLKYSEQKELLDCITDHKNYLEDYVVSKIMLREFMKLLTNKEKKIVQMSIYDDKKIKDICECHNISKNTVLKQKRNALKKIEAHILDNYNE